MQVVIRTWSNLNIVKFMMSECRDENITCGSVALPNLTINGESYSFEP